MLDGMYQSLMCFFMPYCLYSPGRFNHMSGLDINDRVRMGVLVGTAAVFASNAYILMNTYRWDWLTVLINCISSLLIFFWTGIYSCFTASGQFYQSAHEVYGALTFWTVLLITIILCLLPRFSIKAIQKVYFPRDVDIIREQITQGRFKYLDQFETYVPPSAAAMASTDSATSSELGKPIQPDLKQDPTIPEDERPIYPPSVAPSLSNTHNPRSHNSSTGTDYTASIDYHQQYSPDQARTSWDPTGPSVGRVRRSWEASSDFPSSGMLSRVESTNDAPQSPHSPLKSPNDPPTNPA